MSKKFKLILGLFGLTVISLIATGCTSKTTLDEYRAKGYTVSVTYDANGGSYLGRSGVTLMDMFNPGNYQADENGEVHIKLKEPTDTSRPTSGSDPITLTKSGYFFAGWYQTREIETNESGNAVDEDGVELKEKDGVYYYDDENETVATPAYLYSDYWDFENDTINCPQTFSADDDPIEITLYAGWVSYYEFNYYYKIGSTDGEWTKYDGTTTFDYKTTNGDAKKADKDTIWIPEWADGAMKYTHSYLDGAVYTFPEIIGATFNSAYTDADCTERIEGSLEHGGTLDVEHALAGNRVQNVYIIYDEGTRYKIETAEQFVNNSNADGIYEILDDLDFNGLVWPTVNTATAFNGQIYGAEEGRVYTFSNISATYNNTTVYGGLFGYISEGAVIKNIAFKDATFDIVSAVTRSQNAQFGLFAGEIAEGAQVSGVSIDGLIKIGVMSLGNDYSFHLLANGDTEGVTAGTIALQVYGDNMLNNGNYYYRVNPESVSVDADGYVTMTFSSQYIVREQAYYEIDIISE